GEPGQAVRLEAQQADGGGVESEGLEGGDEDEQGRGRVGHAAQTRVDLDHGDQQGPDPGRRRRQADRQAAFAPRQFNPAEATRPRGGGSDGAGSPSPVGKEPDRSGAVQAEGGAQAYAGRGGGDDEGGVGVRAPAHQRG